MILYRLNTCIVVFQSHKQNKKPKDGCFLFADYKVTVTEEDAENKVLTGAISRADWGWKVGGHQWIRNTVYETLKAHEDIEDGQQVTIELSNVHIM